MSKPDFSASIYSQLADAAEVQIAAIARQRDLWRRLAKLFTPPEKPFPTIVPPPIGPDPDFDDVPQAGADASPPEAAP